MNLPSPEQVPCLVWTHRSVVRDKAMNNDRSGLLPHSRVGNGILLYDVVQMALVAFLDYLIAAALDVEGAATASEPRILPDFRAKAVIAGQARVFL